VIARSIEELHIDCDFERRDAYTYTIDADRIPELQAEAELTRELGLPSRYSLTTPLPYAVAGAVIFNDQAQFQPYAYLAAIARAIVDDGGEVYEDTRATGLDADRDDDMVEVRTEHGRILARDVVIATNIPFVEDGLYTSRTTPIAHAVIAARLDGPGPDGM